NSKSGHITLCHVYFFFSSRRRHTRFSRDWSSDVCSSDLDERLPAVFERTDAAGCAWERRLQREQQRPFQGHGELNGQVVEVVDRSEERRGRERVEISEVGVSINIKAV